MANRFANIGKATEENEKRIREYVLEKHKQTLERLAQLPPEEQPVWAQYRDQVVAEHMKKVAKAFGIEEEDDDEQT